MIKSTWLIQLLITNLCVIIKKKVLLTSKNDNWILKKKIILSLWRIHIINETDIVHESFEFILTQRLFIYYFFIEYIFILWFTDSQIDIRWMKCTDHNIITSASFFPFSVCGPVFLRSWSGGSHFFCKGFF